MTENNKAAADCIRIPVQGAVRHNIKFHDDVITFGQAVVTSHFLQQKIVDDQQAKWNEIQPTEFRNNARSNTNSPQKEFISQMSSMQHASTEIPSKELPTESHRHLQMTRHLEEHGQLNRKQKNLRGKGQPPLYDFKSVAEALSWPEDPPKNFEDLKPRNSYINKFGNPEPDQYLTEQRDKLVYFPIQDYLRCRRDLTDDQKVSIIQLQENKDQNKQEENQNNDMFDGVLNETDPQVDLTQQGRKRVKIQQDEKSEIQSQRTATTRKSGKSGKSGKSSQKSRRKSKSVPKTKEEKKMDARRSEFLNTTRWIADSSFTTYFGKPAFHLYGRGNTNPAVGGITYGHNMLSHNINAECGDNPPPQIAFYGKKKEIYYPQQSYESAITKGIQKNQGFIKPSPPRFKEKVELSAEQLEEIQNRLPIMPKSYKGTKKEGEKNQKFPIKIAAPEMTMTGFEHPRKVLKKKRRLNEKAKQEEFERIWGKKPQHVEVVSRNDRSQMSRKSSLKPSGRRDLDSDDSLDTEDANKELAENDGLPMNQEIELSDHNLQDDHLDSQLVQQTNKFEKLGEGVPTQVLDPKSYAFVPSDWTQRIRGAGQQTKRSEQINDVLHNPQYHVKGEKVQVQRTNFLHHL